METIKLYDADAYEIGFDGVIQSVEPREDGQYDIILDQTLFFPEEGGQTPDRGYLGDIPVLDVQIGKDQVIRHRVAESMDPGVTVHGEIDWKHRFSNMQQHTGEHIFSGIVYAKKGYANVGFHLSDNIVTMDYDGMLTPEEIREIEWESNQRIAANLPITCVYPSEAELANLQYRSKMEIEGPIRIVTIQDTDVCACCAPHVRTTAEVGILKVVDYQKYKGGIRLSILCGLRALQDYRDKQDWITESARKLSVSPEQLPETIEKVQQDLTLGKVAVGEANTRLMEMQLSQVPQDIEDVILFTESIPNVVQRNAVNTLVENHPGYCAIFNKEGEQYRYIIGTAQGDARQLLKSMAETLGAKGGGKPEMVQGSLTADEQEIRAWFCGCIS